MPNGEGLSSMSKSELEELSKSSEAQDVGAIGEIKSEVESRVNNAEIVEQTYAGAKEKERLGISMSLLQKAMRESNLQGGVLHVDSEIKGEFLDLSQEEVDEGNPNRPQIWFKQIKETRGIIRRREVAADEVLVISRLNNSDKKGESTVVVGLVKQKNGMILADRYNPGFYTTLKESQYQRIISTPHEELDSRGRLMKDYLSGEVDIKQQGRNFKHYLGKSYKKYWREHDKKIEDTPERWTTRQNLREGFFEELNNNYTELLQHTTERYSKIIKEQEKRELERRQRVEAIYDENHPLCQNIINMYLEALRGNQADVADLCKTQLLESGLSQSRLLEIVEGSMGVQKEDAGEVVHIEVKKEPEITEEIESLVDEEQPEGEEEEELPPEEEVIAGEEVVLPVEEMEEKESVGRRAWNFLVEWNNKIEYKLINYIANQHLNEERNKGKEPTEVLTGALKKNAVYAGLTVAATYLFYHAGYESSAAIMGAVVYGRVLRAQALNRAYHMYRRKGEQ